MAECQGGVWVDKAWHILHITVKVQFTDIAIFKAQKVGFFSALFEAIEISVPLSLPKVKKKD